MYATSINILKPKSNYSLRLYHITYDNPKPISIATWLCNPSFLLTQPLLLQLLLLLLILHHLLLLLLLLSTQCFYNSYSFNSIITNPIVITSTATRYILSNTIIIHPSLQTMPKCYQVLQLLPTVIVLRLDVCLHTNQVLHDL